MNAFLFDEHQFNQLFPFYILINKELKVDAMGKSIEKLCHLQKQERFTDHFIITRPYTHIERFQDLSNLQNQLIVLESIHDKQIIIRGQLEHLKNSDQILFIGSPWFATVEQLTASHLTLNDFAHHDPLIDLLHLLKAQDITTEDLKKLVQSFNQQKEELKKANKEIHDVALFPTQNPDPLIRINFKGDVLLNNPAAALLDFFVFDGKTLRNDEFFKIVADTIDKDNPRWTIEAKSGDKDYSFLCVTMTSVGYINVYGRDVTEKKKTQDQLSRLSLVASANKNGVLFTDPYGSITWANEGFCQLTGYTIDEIIGKSPIELCKGPLTDENTLNSIRKNFFKGTGFTEEVIHYKKDGTFFWGRSFGQPLINAEGELTEFFSIIQDVTQEKESQSKMKVLSQIAEENIHAVVIADVEGKITWVNKSFTNMTGYKLADVIGKKPGHLLQGPETDSLTVQYLSEQVKKGLPFTADIINYTKAREKYWLRIQGQAIHNEKGEIAGYFALEEDITKEKESESLFKNALESIGDNVWEHDFQKGKTFFTKSDNQFLGYTSEEITSNSELWWSRVHKDDLHILIENDLNYKNRKANSHSLEYRIIHKNGSILWVLDRGIVIQRDAAGNPMRIIGTHTDITKQKQLEQDLIKAREQAESMAKAKESFLANMSHEIRTPMNAILGMGNQLAKTDLNEKQSFYLNTMKTAAENLLVIINDILDLSKIEAGKLTVERIGFEPKKVSENAILVLMHKAEEKGLSLYNSFTDPQLSDILIGDPYRLNQVLLNLISNSIKFTEKGQIDIRWQVLNDTASTQLVRISVIDSGIGMEKEFVERLFDKFNQEYESVSRNYGGTGLGMSICKELVELMGGHIEVSSEKGVGTTIYFDIEFQKGTCDDIPEQQTSVSVVTNNFLKGRTILIADDNEMNRLLASTVLKNYGADLVEASNGEESIAILQQEHIDLVLMDIQMPVMNGYEATRQLRSMGYTLPVIALTANAVRGENENCIKAGMNDYMAKPFKEDDFLSLIATWLNADQRIESNAKSMSQIQNTAKPCFDLSGLHEISQGDQGFIKKMLELFIEQASLTIIEMRSAYTNNNFTQVKKIAHRIKPSIDSLGIVQLKEEIRDIEKHAEEYGHSTQMNGLLEKTETILNQAIVEMKEYLN